MTQGPSNRIATLELHEAIMVANHRTEQPIPNVARVCTLIGLAIWCAGLPFPAVVFRFDRSTEELNGAMALLTTVVPIYWIPGIPVLGAVFNFVMLCAVWYTIRGHRGEVGLPTAATFLLAAIAVWTIPWLLNVAYDGGARVGTYIWCASFVPVAFGFLLVAVTTHEIDQ